VNVVHPTATIGTIGLVVTIFVESGLLVGIVLPGDSLLLTAGVLASQDKLSLPVVLIGAFLAAVAGDQVGYLLGSRVGPSIFQRPRSRFFRYDHVKRAEAFFERHGAKTVVLARFVPVVRTFTPVVAGVSGMDYRTFTTFNLFGGMLWAGGLTMIGFLFGGAIH
jgi:membrane-associated protein